jgi:hypothetical protein
MSEQELVENETAELEAALSDEPPAQEPEQQAEPEKATQERDEHGRFKAKEAEPEPAAQATENQEKPQAEKPADMVPVWRLNEVSQSRRETISQLEQERQARLTLERQLQELRQAQQPKEPEQAPPDMYADPEGWQRYVIEQAERRAQTQAEQLVTRKLIERDLIRAKEQHGEVFDKAYAALEAELASGNRSNQLRILNAVSPGDELIKWYKQTQFLQEVKDPDEWRKQQEEAIRAKILEELGQGSSERPKVKIPPSLTKVTASSGGNDSIAFASDKEQHAAFFS